MAITKLSIGTPTGKPCEVCSNPAFIFFEDSQGKPHNLCFNHQQVVESIDSDIQMRGNEMDNGSRHGPQV